MLEECSRSVDGFFCCSFAYGVDGFTVDFGCVLDFVAESVEVVDDCLILKDEGFIW